MFKRNTLIETLSLAAAALLVSACGVIPKEYRGEYVDAATGTSLKLTRGKGVLLTADGRELKVKADEIDFERVASGKPGLLVDSNPVEGNLLEVFWVIPDLTTQQEGAGLVWFDAEVLYTQFDTTAKDKVPGFPMFHCRTGAVMLDTLTKRWQIGCPAGPALYQLNRVE